jgi:hypothetical protein
MSGRVESVKYGYCGTNIVAAVTGNIYKRAQVKSGHDIVVGNKEFGD